MPEKLLKISRKTHLYPCNKSKITIVLSLGHIMEIISSIVPIKKGDLEIETLL